MKIKEDGENREIKVKGNGKKGIIEEREGIW